MDKDTKSQDEKQVIYIAYFLGYTGLVPFVALSLIILMANEQIVSVAKPVLHIYGAIILSFLGGLHWGRIASKNHLLPSDKWVLMYSVIPSLIGWFSYIISNIWQESVWIIIIGFILAYFIDRRFIVEGHWRSFMHPLRINLTIIACFCLILSYQT